MIEFKKIKEGLPPVGIPLVVKTFSKIEQKYEIKYPVYYIKEPYSNEYAWYFFPACEGICKLLPEYSEVMYWATLVGGETDEYISNKS